MSRLIIEINETGTKHKPLYEIVEDVLDSLHKPVKVGQIYHVQIDQKFDTKLTVMWCKGKVTKTRFEEHSHACYTDL